MLNDSLRQLPYLVHTNRELGLMLKGIKPLAYFKEIIGKEPECLVRYWRLFDRHVSERRLIKREFIEAAAKPLESRSIFYVLPGEEWRIEAMRELWQGFLRTRGPRTAELERRFGELLGYEPWQMDFWMSRFVAAQSDRRGS